MNCQHCGIHKATIQLHFKINGLQADMHVCESCFQKENQKLGSLTASNKNTPNGFPFHEWFQQEPMNDETTSQKENQKNIEFLSQFGRNMSQMAKSGLLDPVIGREKEIERVIEVLNRRNKNNPVLIGEPGVGKTAIAEGLALRIAAGKVPHKLLTKVVYLLDVSSLVANTGIRGQFEERMKQLITELQQNPQIILFIDEIHLLVGAGSAEGSMDAANILKPSLARGELQVIGATTLKEYRTIEKDAALERRLQPVQVNEPTLEKTVEILTGLKDRYEDYHQVSYTDDAIEAAVYLSSRYIQDRFLPDKAIDLLDEVGSKLNLSIDALPKETIKQRLTNIMVDKEQALKEENYERAAELRDEELNYEKQLQNASSNLSKIEVTKAHIQELIEKKTGIPVGKLESDEQKKMKELEIHLSQKVIGQNQAVKKVVKAVRRSRAGLKSKKRPIGSFLFVGPTGVGKTELSKTLAAELFGSEDKMIRLDMSEYMEKHSVSKIIGSPPGYIGHDEAGQLTEKIRRNPYNIVLLDEIEKAHPDVQHMFLQVLEDGRLTDSQGRTVSFKDTVLIMTSNAGVQEKTKVMGFGENNALSESTLLQSLGSFFKPEFLNRFDNIIEFQSLETDDLMKIVDLLLVDLNQALQDQEIKLEISQEVKEKLASLGYHPAFGARPLRRTIQEYIEDTLADFILDQPDVKNLEACLENDKIIVKSKVNQTVEMGSTSI
jgi:ATP-dependent Clp protease ATP-binding subunit ClpE